MSTVVQNFLASLSTLLSIALTGVVPELTVDTYSPKWKVLLLSGKLEGLIALAESLAKDGYKVYIFPETGLTSRGVQEKTNQIVKEVMDTGQKVVVVTYSELVSFRLHRIVNAGILGDAEVVLGNVGDGSVRMGRLHCCHIAGDENEGHTVFYGDSTSDSGYEESCEAVSRFFYGDHRENDFLDGGACLNDLLAETKPGYWGRTTFFSSED